jgi:predicted metal-dependent hydrolase
MTEMGLVYIISILIICIGVKLYMESDTYNLRCIISNIDSKTYCVRESSRLKEKEVADLLAVVNNRLIKLVNIAYKQSDDAKFKRLKKKFNSTKICETLPTSKFTAYSENKGQKIALCTTTKKNGSELIDINTLTYVAIHECAHIMTIDIGHTPTFWTNFKELLEIATQHNLYNPIDYNKYSREYCGTMLFNNPLFN